MPRVADEVVQELIDNDGCRRGDVEPLAPLGIVRLAHDLQDARHEVARLRRVIANSESAMKALSMAMATLASNTTDKPGRKRTKK